MLIYIYIYIAKAQAQLDQHTKNWQTSLRILMFRVSGRTKHVKQKKTVRKPATDLRKHSEAARKPEVGFMDRVSCAQLMLRTLGNTLGVSMRKPGVSSR